MTCAAAWLPVSALGRTLRWQSMPNQVWDVPTAVDWTRSLAQFGLAWVEEPHPSRRHLGLATICRAIDPVPVASGEHVANRVVFKQLFQAEAIDVMQIDAFAAGTRWSMNPADRTARPAGGRRSQALLGHMAREQVRPDHGQFGR